MNNTLYITNKTSEKVLATISDKNTGNNILICELQPGNNKIEVDGLQEGCYMISLSDKNNDTYYRERMIKETA